MKRTIPVMTILLLASLRAACGATALTNGGFEVVGPQGMPVGWQVGKHYGKASPGATFQTDAQVAQEGDRSLRITSTNGAIPAILLSQFVDIEAGATYVLSAHVKGAATTTAMRMMVVPADFKGIATAALVASNTWQRHAITFKAALTAAPPANLRFDLMAPGTVWVDNVRWERIRPGTGAMSDAAALLPPSEIPDGSFERAAPGALPPRWQIGKHYGRTPAGATFEVDGTVARTGSRSLKITSPSDEGIPAIALSSPVAVEPGVSYVITAYMRSAARTADAQILALRTDFKSSGSAPLVLTDQWRRYRLVFEASKTAEAYFARFDAGQGTVWIDDVSLTRLDATAGDDGGPALGYRYADTPGAADVTLAVDGPTGRTWSMANGVCYAYGFGARELSPAFADAKVKVVRLHNVLTHLKILQKQADGSFAYDYTLLDKAIGEILAIGAVPQLSLCFVPPEMVDSPDPAKIRDHFFLGQPSDYGKWEAYIFDLVRHCSEKYPNVNDWYWIFGNEPGVRQFSMGTQEEFYRLYKHTLAAAVRAQPRIQIGAGSFAHPEWRKDFVERCDADHTRLDLLSWHHYDLVPEDYAVKIQDVRDLLAAHPAYANAKLAIDEWNTILPDNRPADCSAGNYAAAHVAASIHAMRTAGLTYQTHFIANSPHGWGMMHKAVKHPVFNAFQLLGRMGPQELRLKVPEGEPYVGGCASRTDEGARTILVWHAKSRNDISRDVTKSITLTLEGVALPASVTRYVIDAEHSNGLADPKRQELETVETAARRRDNGGGVEIRFDAPANSLSLLVVN